MYVLSLPPSPALAYRDPAAYYAAQLGISLKAQDPNSRKLLLNLLDALERLKKEIGPNDTIDVEPASAAYVENFALKVFRMADDEDRAGNATKYMLFPHHASRRLIRTLLQVNCQKVPRSCQLLRSSSRLPKDRRFGNSTFISELPSTPALTPRRRRAN